jgi:sterol 3beta-glucosyltransferase
MKVLMLATGSRGDVQPLVALGAGLKKRGHGVIIAAAPDHQHLVEEHHLDFRTAGPNVKELIQDLFAKGGR